MVVYGGVDNRYDALNKSVVVLETGIWDWWAPPVKGVGPDGICGTSSCAMPDRQMMLVFGGQNQEGEVQEDLSLLHVRRWKWEKIQVKGKSPAARSYASMVQMVQDSRKESSVCVLFGGSLLESVTCDTHVLRNEGKKWWWEQPAIRGCPPNPRHEHCAVMVKDDMIVFGGHNGHVFYHDMHVLSCETWEWSEVRTFGSPAWEQGTSFNMHLLGEDQLVVMSSDGQADMSLHTLDLDSLEWRKPILTGLTLTLIPTLILALTLTLTLTLTIGEMPTTRFGFSLAETEDGKMLLFGGCSDSTTYNDTVMVDFHLPWSYEKWLWMARNRPVKGNDRCRLGRIPKKILRKIINQVPWFG